MPTKRITTYQAHRHTRSLARLADDLTIAASYLTATMPTHDTTHAQIDRLIGARDALRAITGTQERLPL